MKFNEMFTCPVCGKKNVSILQSSSLISDVRSDIIRCNDPECLCVWRGYSFVSECTIEIIDSGVSDTKDETSEENHAEEVVTEEHV